MQTHVTNIVQISAHKAKDAFSKLNINNVPMKKKKKFVTNDLAMFAK